MSQEFTKFSPAFYTGRVGDAIRGDAVCLAMGPYLIGGTHSTPSGVFRLPLAYIEEDLGLEREAIKKGLAKLEEAEFLVYDSRARAVWIRDKARHEWGALKETDNRAKKMTRTIEKVVSDFGRCTFIEDFVSQYSEAWPWAFATLPKPSQSPPKALVGTSSAAESLAEALGKGFSPPPEALAKTSQRVPRAGARGRAEGRGQRAEGREEESDSPIGESGPPERPPTPQQQRIGQLLDAAQAQGAHLPEKPGGALAKSWAQYRSVHGEAKALPAMLGVIRALSFTECEPGEPSLRYLLGALRSHLDETKSGKRKQRARPRGPSASSAAHPDTLAQATALDGVGA